MQLTIRSRPPSTSGSASTREVGRARVAPVTERRDQLRGARGRAVGDDQAPRRRRARRRGPRCAPSRRRRSAARSGRAGRSAARRARRAARRRRCCRRRSRARVRISVLAAPHARARGRSATASARGRLLVRDGDVQPGDAGRVEAGDRRCQVPRRRPGTGTYTASMPGRREGGVLHRRREAVRDRDRRGCRRRGSCRERRRHGSAPRRSHVAAVGCHFFLRRERRLRRREPRDRHAVRRAGHVVEPDPVAELDRARIAAVLAADADLELRSRACGPSRRRSRISCADARRGRGATNGSSGEDAAARRRRAGTCPASSRERPKRHLRQVVGAEGEELGVARRSRRR